MSVIYMQKNMKLPRKRDFQCQKLASSTLFRLFQVHYLIIYDYLHGHYYYLESSPGPDRV